MRRTFTPAEVHQVRQLEGSGPAQDIGQLFGVGAETIRRIWRRETYWQVAKLDETAEGAAASLERLNEALSEGEGNGSGNDHAPSA